MHLSFIAIVAWILGSAWAQFPKQTVLQANLPRTKSVAIIGGGAAGTSTAFWLRNVFPEGTGITLQTTLYERSNHFGGRSTVVPIKNDPSLGLIELGASIFVKVNYNLMNATERFGFERVRLTSNATRGLGIWDGKTFLFEETGNSVWDKIKGLWRYGLAPLKFQRHLRQLLRDHFVALYEHHVPPFDNLPETLSFLRLEDAVKRTAEDYLAQYNQPFVQEIVQTATRANYGQNIQKLHAFAAMVSMAASDGAWSIKGGNFKLFEEFAKRSQASLRLGTSVVSVTNHTHVDDDGRMAQRYLVTTEDGSTEEYDAVILAAPLHLADIDLRLGKAYGNPRRVYHDVHVTLIAGHPDPNYFGRTVDTMPSFVVTVGHPLVDDTASIPFTTFAVHRVLTDGQRVVKIFSPKRLEEDTLDALFHNRSWTYHHQWHAFPKLVPVTDTDEPRWPSMVLDGFDKDDMDNDGVLYLGAFESFISVRRE